MLVQVKHRITRKGKRTPLSISLLCLILLCIELDSQFPLICHTVKKNIFENKS